MSRVPIGATLLATTLLIAACVGDPPVLGEYAIPACMEDVMNDPANCGACGNACSSGMCVRGVCTCPEGRGDCDGIADNGCETSLDSDDDHCGACNHSCSGLSNAVGHCASGRCELFTCTPGYLDCDGVSDNGCEVNVVSDPLHCGNCTHPCNPGLMCISGTCTAAFPVSTSFASPSSSGGLLIVPRPITVSLGGVGTAAIHYSIDGTAPSLTAASPITISSFPTSSVNGAHGVLRWFADSETPHATVFQLDTSTKDSNGYLLEGFTFASSASHVIEVTKGALLSASAMVQVWSPSKMRLQVVYGFDITPVGCFFDDVASPYGNTGGTSVTPVVGGVAAPTTSGLHLVRVDLRAVADCASALATSFTSTAIDVGAVFVK